MKIGKKLCITGRGEWQKWLAGNHDKEKEIWLVYYRKSSGKARIAYNDAVEEALAVGWIDSTIKKIDEDSTAQRFTPRNPKSGYSQANVERLRKLAEQGRLAPSVREAVRGILAKEFIFPPDIMAKIKANQEAWKNFKKFSPVYQRIRVSYVDGARERPAEFIKRLKHLIDASAKNKRFGFGGIDKYY